MANQVAAYRGTKGFAYSAKTNMFEITKLPTSNFHHYDITFEPEVKSGRQARELVDTMQIRYAEIFDPICPFDGRRNLFSIRELRIPATGRFVVTFGREIPGRRPPKTYTVMLTKVSVVRPSTLQKLLDGRSAYGDADQLVALNLLHVILRHAAIQKNPHTPRAIFTEAGRKDIDYGLEIWRGFHQSVKPTLGKMLVNLNATNAAMYQAGPLLRVVMSYVDSVMGGRGGRPDVRQLEQMDPHLKNSLTKFLKKLRVFKVVNGQKSRSRPIKALIMKGAQTKFEKDGVEITVERHFRDTYNVRLSYPNIFAVQIGAGEIIPLEFLEVEPGQIYKGQIPASCRSKMLEFAKMRPTQRLESVMRAQSVLDYRNSPVIRQSGIQVSEQPVEVQGRVLDTPLIGVGQKQQLRVKDGAWNMLRSQFVHPKTITAWAIVMYAGTMEDGQRCATELKKSFQDLGMGFPPQPPAIVQLNGQGNQDSIANGLLNVGKNMYERTKQNPDLLVVILPQNAEPIRNAVKNFGDVRVGVATQCMRLDKLRSGNDQYFKNIILKINAKLGGTNFASLGAASQWMGTAPTMLVGADVSHPGPGSTLPSVSGVVSSMDELATRYTATTNVQETRVERIVDLAEMMANAIEMFWKFQSKTHKRDVMPARICFFRDGLSEGEFESVSAYEMELIQKGIDMVWKRYERTGPKPKVIYIVVIKRHHVRFFPLPNSNVDRSGNAPAGFVIDHSITNPTIKNWYLQSHSGLLGTSRPGYYTVLHDQIGIGPDQLQELCNGLCYNFARATRAVSIPTPVYYADLVCARAKFHVQQWTDLADSQSASEGDQVLGIEHYKRVWKQRNDLLKYNSYWM
ncbi:Piwi-domain-containing protein [Sistotremastrum suecicum HHB10207 ss-3]|uniref:Piwi-domain-containing protein n=1 Tax=Sistotremastrum suecicum HHB10207 ss-3 TaxID=1314776 RepID=A0A166IMD1_9AGAM|nr:Piwi-domain-containing protein [Sistotremastrum suecicum HHB10207 ss-3]